MNQTKNRHDKQRQTRQTHKTDKNLEDKKKRQKTQSEPVVLLGQLAQGMHAQPTLLLSKFALDDILNSDNFLWQRSLYSPPAPPAPPSHPKKKSSAINRIATKYRSTGKTRNSQFLLHNANALTASIDYIQTVFIATTTIWPASCISLIALHLTFDHDASMHHESSH